MTERPAPAAVVMVNPGGKAGRGSSSRPVGALRQEVAEVLVAVRELG